jgi:hypothetical protein
MSTGTKRGDGAVHDELRFARVAVDALVATEGLLKTKPTGEQGVTGCSWGADIAPSRRTRRTTPSASEG